MERLHPRMKALILILLPLGAGGIAEEDPAAEWSDHMNATKAADLKWATGPIPRPRRLRLSAPDLQFIDERCKLHGRDIETMSKLLKPAASSRGVADRPVHVDRALQIVINLLHRVAHFGAPRSAINRIEKL
jgi:hypothetical protein